MSSITNKALVIAVGIFVTIAITSGILLTIGKMRDIYQDVYQTDISLSNRFSEFDEYDGTEKTGLEVANTLNKYQDGNYYSDYEVNVKVIGSDKNGMSYASNTFDWSDKTERIKNGDYSAKFTSAVNVDDSKAEVTITFTKN